MNIHKYLWLIPFCSFIIGYKCAEHLFQLKNITVPSFIGKTIHDVVAIASAYNITIQLVDHKEERDIPEGIVVSQTPCAGSIIKEYQHIYIVTTKKPAAIEAPRCVGLLLENLIPELKQKGILVKAYYLPHIYPKGTCFSQIPTESMPLENNTLLVYVSSGYNRPVVWPSFIGHSLSVVLDFLEKNHIKPYIINDSAYIDIHNSHIIDQRPLARTLVTLDDTLSVQLRIQ
jgi:serine/threonine-protein kinase